MPYCSDCGEHVGSEVRFCPNCGAEVHGWERDTAGDQGGRGSGNRQQGQGGQQGRGGGTQESQTGQGGQQGGAPAPNNPQPAQGAGHGGATGGATGGGTAGGGTGGGTAGGGATGGASGGGAPNGGAAGGGTAGGGAAGRGSAGAAGTAGTAGAAGAASATAATQVQGSGPATNPEGPMPFESGAFGHAFGFATQDDYDPILIGAVIEFAGAFIPFVALIVRGYGFRLARATARGQLERPEFDDYGGMFVDGLKILAHILAFGFVWFLVTGVLAAGAWVVSDAAGTVVFGLGTFVGAYLFPASNVAYAATDSFGAAFSPEYAGGFAFSLSYLKAYLLAAIIAPLYFVVLVVSIFTIVGVFVVAAWGTYFFYSFWGYFYREAAASGSVTPAPADPVVAD